ncbi:MAG: ATP synthase F1 subunit delta [Clostridia bacterium]|nr:ATP synthase F1 subunit delta [Clostridia bacterium]
MNERVGLYSSSLYDVASEEHCEKEVYECLSEIKRILSENGEYAAIVSSASIPSVEREKLIDEAFGAFVHPFVLNFMKLLAQKRLFYIFEDVAKEYEKTYFKNNNIEHASITTAIELDDEKKKSIVERIEKTMGKKIIPSFLVDASILGGIVIETENSNIDASVTGALGSIKRFLRN